MKCINIRYQSPRQLETLIQDEELAGAPNLLVQIFSGITEGEQTRAIAQILRRLLPKAVIIGATTSGEILEGHMLENSVVLSLARFEKTRLIPIDHPACDDRTGGTIGQQLKSPAIKGAILFTEGISGQPEALINGIIRQRPDLVIAGGAAGDNGKFLRTWIIYGDKIRDHGVVGVAFENPDLILGSDARLGYLPLGKTMTVTKAEGHRLIGVDNQPITEIIRRYLGEHTLANLPADVVHFPLLKEHQGALIARAPVAAPGDGSLIYAGNFTEGEKIRFGVANTTELIATVDEAWQTVRATPAEAIWIYSCMGRKAYLGKNLEIEFAPLNTLPLSGFFTYGEFFHSGKSNHMLNLTTTVLSLSEGGSLQSASPKTTLHPHEETPLRTLSHLINTITAELEEKSIFLEGYRLAADKSAIVSKTDPRGMITYVNDAFCRISGFNADELLGKSHRIVKHPDTPRAVHKAIWENITRGRVWQGVLKNRAKDGSAYFADTTIVPLKDAEGHIVEFICMRHDISKLIAQEQTIAGQMSDPLTALPNRNAFFEQLPKTENPVVALLNVDRFRDINSFYGFKAGDQLLKELSDLLSSLCANRFRLYRAGGDLFLILGDNIKTETFENAVRAMLKAVAANPFLEQSFSASIRLSAGIAAGAWQILSRAEAALNRAQERRIELAIGLEDDEKSAQQNLKIVGILKQAVAQPWWVVPFFQPIARAADGVIVKYEALMRLRDGEGKIHAPAAFLELAKHSRYYPDLTRAMIRSSLEQFKNRVEGVTLNLAAEDIQNPQTMAFLREAILNFGDPARVTLEVTESEMIEDYDRVIAAIAEMKKLGVKIAIDDFGSGYSNFAYLIQFQADYLKIDGSIVRRIVTDEKAYETLCAIVDFAKRIKIETVAEFISSEAIALKVKEAGVDYWQGYFIAQPAPL